jgi:hypothetical protein
MAGQPGRSGRPPLPAHVHLLNGTHRVDRHGPREAAVPPPPPVPIGRARRARALEGLQDAGREFVRGLLDAYGDWAPHKIALLREAAEATDTLAAIRQAIAAAGGPAEASARLLRTEHQASARLLRAVAALGLKG